jgi:hypothetical protein
MHYGVTLHLLGLHDVLRRLLYLPVIAAAIAAGSRGGLAVAGLAAVGFLPHLSQLESAGDRVIDLVIELLLLLLVGAVVGKFVDFRRRAHAVAAERSQRAALGEIGLTLMTQTEGPLASIGGQADSIAFMADLSSDRATAFAASMIRKETTRVQLLFADLRKLITSTDNYLKAVDLGPLVIGVVQDIARESCGGSRLSLARAEQGCRIVTDRRIFAMSLRSLLFELLEIVPTPGRLEVSLLNSETGEVVLEITALSDPTVAANFERSLSRVFGADSNEYRFQPALFVRVLSALGANVTSHSISPGKSSVLAHFRPVCSNGDDGGSPRASSLWPSRGRRRRAASRESNSTFTASFPFDAGQPITQEVVMFARIVGFSLLALVVLAGCSENTPGPTSPPLSAPVSIAPSDGTGDVRLDAAVTLGFTAAVDRLVVERDFHLISEFDMMNGSIPDSMMAMHGEMMAVMRDSMMMQHMSEYHATAGHFIWNAAGTECVFQPDSPMRPQSRYMIHMGPEMSQMMESRMGSMDGMSGHGSGSMANDMMFHFSTMDTTNGGHAGHH